ncbi:MAG: hypothetical protein Q4G30_01010 [Actinomycetaceae bacterium]|nr:hypothetical protein [Actinomycetaceae bacterium]
MRRIPRSLGALGTLALLLGAGLASVAPATLASATPTVSDSPSLADFSNVVASTPASTPPPSSTSAFDELVPIEHTEPAPVPTPTGPSETPGQEPTPTPSPSPTASLPGFIGIQLSSNLPLNNSREYALLGSTYEFATRITAPEKNFALRDIEFVTYLPLGVSDCPVNGGLPSEVGWKRIESNVNIDPVTIICETGTNEIDPRYSDQDFAKQTRLIWKFNMAPSTSSQVSSVDIKFLLNITEQMFQHQPLKFTAAVHSFKRANSIDSELWTGTQVPENNILSVIYPEPSSHVMVVDSIGFLGTATKPPDTSEMPGDDWGDDYPVGPVGPVDPIGNDEPVDRNAPINTDTSPAPAFSNAHPDFYVSPSEILASEAKPVVEAAPQNATPVKQTGVQDAATLARQIAFAHSRPGLPGAMKVLAEAPGELMSLSATMKKDARGEIWTLSVDGMYWVNMKSNQAFLAENSGLANTGSAAAHVGPIALGCLATGALFLLWGVVLKTTESRRAARRK